MKGTLTGSGRPVCLVLTKFDASPLCVHFKTRWRGVIAKGEDVWMIQAFPHCSLSVASLRVERVWMELGMTTMVAFPISLSTNRRSLDMSLGGSEKLPGLSGGEGKATVWYTPRPDSRRAILSQFRAHLYPSVREARCRAGRGSFVMTWTCWGG